jgi:hypothetical protein
MVGAAAVLAAITSIGLGSQSQPPRTQPQGNGSFSFG